MNYTDLGYNQFLTKISPIPEGQSGMGNNVNFEQMQVSGNMGDTWTIGNMTFDGINGRIIINDGTTDRILIGRED